MRKPKMKITTIKTSPAKIKGTKGARHFWTTFPLAIPQLLIVPRQKRIDKGKIVYLLDAWLNRRDCRDAICRQCLWAEKRL